MLSRVADNLYWMSRYLERAEHTARLLDVNLDEMLDQTPAASDRRWDLLLASLQIDYASLQLEESDNETEKLVYALTMDAKNQSSIVYAIEVARENARQVREQISSEMWIQLNRLYQEIRKTSIGDIWEGGPHAFYQPVVKEGVHMFQGITDATMSHGEGWHFIQLGRFLERALAMANLLEAHFEANEDFGHETIEADLEWVALLKSCTAFEAYCKVYTAQIQPKWVAEYLLLNGESPRSVRFAADRLMDSAKAIALLTGKQRGDRVTRLAGRLSSMLDYGTVDEIMADGLSDYCADIRSQCVKIHDAIYNRYVQPQEIVVS